MKMKRILAVVLMAAMLTALALPGGAETVLKKGDTGADVVRLQERLIQLGYLVGEASGIFDDAAEAALMAFQRRSGLLATGMADRITWAELFSENARENVQESKNAYWEDAWDGAVYETMDAYAYVPAAGLAATANGFSPDAWNTNEYTFIRENGFQKVKDVVPGGVTRVDSVHCGLNAMSENMELAAIQDGARPLVTPEIIERAVMQAVKCHAAAPAIPLKDTVKEIDGFGRVLSTPPRETLRAVQTPQVFQKDLLIAAWEKARKEGKTYTDDCGAMEALGISVYLIEGSEENLKITTPLDLFLAEHILQGREAP